MFGMQSIEELRWLDEDLVRDLVNENDTPFYVYSKKALLAAVDEVKQALSEIPYGLTIRYAMKANPHPDIIKLFIDSGLHLDASSEFEAMAALNIRAPSK